MEKFFNFKIKNSCSIKDKVVLDINSTQYAGPTEIYECSTFIFNPETWKEFCSEIDNFRKQKRKAKK